ncbi:uncharacterized protein [Aegilops tauschii subsp. strangulata]|uniref:Uncharacterized protein n=1 Tax=Aegilops tauschii subsp. strangulata TaxID=200361 RepID=A0A452XXL9_AEGTS|nr:uncharacterized protein LOC120973273 [Aegilops tauschii subsp. strangulata]
MEWEPDEQHLGDLGVTGIRRETLRVLRAILPSFLCHVSNIFIFLAHVAGCVTVFSSLVSGDLSRLLHLFFSPAFFYFLCDFAVMEGYDMLFVLSVASFYRNKGADHRAGPMAIPRLLRRINRDQRLRHCATFLLAVTAFGGYTAVFGSAWRTLRLLHAPGEIVLPLRLLGGAACIAGVVYLAVLLRMACVVSLLENASGFGALCRSRELLAGKFWAAATVFAVLDGCFVAMLMAFPTVTVEDAMGGMGLGQFAAVAMMTAILCVVMTGTLVAQPVVYLVCKNYHHNPRTLLEV